MIIMTKSTPASGHNWIYDLLFLALAAAYAFLAYKGIVGISAGGVSIDSDLQTYAQGMAGEKQPDFFANDPVLNAKSAANSIPNLERYAATILTPGTSYGLGLLRAGAIAIFFYYSLWYMFGRWLYKNPALAATLALAMGITVWVGWGTFWGVAHSDPVPRVFFAAIFPCLLLLALWAINRPWLRPLTMFCAGLCMWVHGISALNCGAMFFVAFIFVKPEQDAPGAHITNCMLSLIAFLAPVLFYLWPSLSQGGSFSKEDLAVFSELFSLRWRKDYVGFGSRILNFINPFHTTGILLVAGLICWAFLNIKGDPREKLLCRLYFPFTLALTLVTIFCWAESRYAPDFGRLPMGHELARGLRFLVPLAWLAIIGALGRLLGITGRRVLLCATLASLFVLTTDRQFMAAQLGIYEYTGIRLPLVGRAEKEMAAAKLHREVLNSVASIVPKGEVVASDSGDMAIRFYGRHPLSHSFKDGYIFFYNKDVNGSRRWLENEKKTRSGPNGYIEAWTGSSTPWLLTRQTADKASLLKYGDIVLDKNGWLLVRKKKED